MDLNIQIPDNTASIFEYLQKGLFISSNSTSEEVRDMYNEIDENYESLYQYFSQINYTLERGNEYFFFSRIEPKATLEQKIMRAYYWIDVLDFFKTYDETFGPGFRFQPEQILVNADGSLSADYCTYCYQQGKFAQDCTMDEMIEHCAQFVEEFNKDSEQKVTKEEAIAMMKQEFPKLKRWQA